MKNSADLYSPSYSVCTIVNDMAEYRLMKNSFLECGFDETSGEYIYFDNTEGNRFDAYAGVKQALQTAKNRFVIMVHQDVRCIDHKTKLDAILQALSAADPSWAICGNAGVVSYHHAFINIAYENETRQDSKVPMKVKTLDENFLIFDTEKKIEVSNLSGFHMYGTDVCLHAASNGYSCYVLPFMVKHLSKGNLKALTEYLPYYLENTHYDNVHGYVETTCTKFYLGTSKASTKMANKPLPFFFVKFLQRLKGIFKN